jgi:hypothetical protein
MVAVILFLLVIGFSIYSWWTTHEIPYTGILGFLGILTAGQFSRANSKGFRLIIEGLQKKIDRY